MQLEEQFRHIIKTQFSVVKEDTTILLAVSGGIDSMVLLHLFQSLSQYSIAVAHCNYKLRSESDADAAFVQSYCQKHSIPYFEKLFDTKKEASEAKSGIQETARKLRYAFFDELCNQHQYSFIATAHHQNDSAETILFNLTRGTGSKGMQGIAPFSKNIIRPLINFLKADIESFAELNKIDYREDSSNKKNDYSRNKIRNTVIPILTEINPKVISHITQLGKHIGLMDSYIQQELSKLNTQVIQSFKTHLEINLSAYKSSQLLPLYISHFIGYYDLSFTQLQNLIDAYQQGKSGAQFFGNEKTYIVSRDTIIVQQPSQSIDNINLVIQNLANHAIETSIGTIHFSVSSKIPTVFEEGKLYVDASKLQFPITIRNWENGDYFSPLGLNGTKTVSDFLIDKKVNSLQKSKTLVVEDTAEKLIGVVGFQIDNSCKIDSNTTTILSINLT